MANAALEIVIGYMRVFEGDREPPAPFEKAFPVCRLWDGVYELSLVDKPITNEEWAAIGHEMARHGMSDAFFVRRDGESIQSHLIDTARAAKGHRRRTGIAMRCHYCGSEMQ